MKLRRIISPRRPLSALARAGLLGLLLGGTGVSTCPLPAKGLPPAQSKEKSGKAASEPVLAAPLVPEKGKFRILLDGKQVGFEEFQISSEGSDAEVKEWTAHGVTEIRLADGNAVRVSGRLKLTPGGLPLRYEWSALGEKKASAAIEFHGSTAKIALQLEGARPYIQELTFPSPRVVILDNNLYHHYAVLARLYDWNAGGAQTFPVLIPQDMTPGSITVESLGRAKSDSGEPALSGAEGLELLRVRTADLEVDLYLDSAHRLVRLAVPASKVVILRE